MMMMKKLRMMVRKMYIRNNLKKMIIYQEKLLIVKNLIKLINNNLKKIKDILILDDEDSNIEKYKEKNEKKF